MAFSQFPTEPVYQGPGGLPAHPILQPLRRSRGPPDVDSEAAGTLSEYRENLVHILNSERWGHHRTLHYMTQEREQMTQDIVNLRTDCESWASAWTTCNHDLARSESERLALLQELVALQMNFNNLQDALTKERAAAENRRLLDMTSAKDRQIQILRRKVSQKQEEISRLSVSSGMNSDYQTE